MNTVTDPSVKGLAHKLPNPCGAHLLARALKRHGVEVLFGQSLPSALLLVIPEFGMQQVAYRTENAGGAMADGYARASQKVAVVKVQAWVEENGLTLNPDKTHVGDCREDERPFLPLSVRNRAEGLNRCYAWVNNLGSSFRWNDGSSVFRCCGITQLLICVSTALRRKAAVSCFNTCFATLCVGVCGRCSTNTT